MNATPLPHQPTALGSEPEPVALPWADHLDDADLAELLTDLGRTLVQAHVDDTPPQQQLATLRRACLHAWLIATSPATAVDSHQLATHGAADAAHPHPAYNGGRAGRPGTEAETVL